MSLYDDSNIEKINASHILRIDHLEPNLEYKKLISFIEEELNMYGASFRNIDYKSAKLILDYAKNNNMKMFNIFERLLLFINRLPEDIARKLFVEYGCSENIERLTSIMDSEFYRVIINGFRDLIPYTDEELRIARKENIEKILLDDEQYFEHSDNLSRIIGSSNYYDYKEKEYIYNSKDSFESADTVIKNVYKDLFSEYIFNDRYQNISRDVDVLIRYAKEFGKDEDLDSIETLQEICQRVDVSGIYGLQFLFERLKDSDILKLFHSLQEKYSQETYSSLVSNSTNFTKEYDAYDEMASRLNECDTYYLDGQDFNAFVRSDVQIDKSKTSAEETQINRISHSFTYIGKKNIQTYKDPRQYLTMIYTGITEDNIGHVYHDDSWSGDSGSFTISDYYTADSLLEKSQQYPEIWMKNFTDIKPFAILCLDEATNWDYEVAKKHGLSIVILNTQKYERKYNHAEMGEMRI